MSAWFAQARTAQLAVVAPIKSCSGIKALDLSRGAVEPARIDSAEIAMVGERQFWVVKGYVAPTLSVENRPKSAHAGERDDAHARRARRDVLPPDRIGAN
jgi:hypothetical protein